MATAFPGSLADSGRCRQHFNWADSGSTEYPEGLSATEAKHQQSLSESGHPIHLPGIRTNLLVLLLFQTIQKTEKHTEEEAKNIAQKKAEDKLNEQITNSEDIKNKTVNVVTTNEYVEVEVIYEVLENIGTEEKIVF